MKLYKFVKSLEKRQLQDTMSVIVYCNLSIFEVIARFIWNYCPFVKKLRTSHNRRFAHVATQ